MDQQEDFGWSVSVSAPNTQRKVYIIDERPVPGCGGAVIGSV